MFPLKLSILLCYFRVNDPVAMKLLNKAGEMPSLEPPDDESIRTLYVGGLDARITEQDLRDNFYAHGEIESVKMVLQKACAFVTYTTREGAEKAAEELSNKLVIKGLRMKLLWGRPQALRLESEGGASDEAKQQAALTHSGLLPRAVISQQQNQPLQALPPGTQGQAPPMPYFNIPPLPPQHERAYYPSMDPQRMGALVPSQEAGGPSGSNENRSGPEQQHHHQRYGYNPSMGPPPPGGQFYPPYYNPQFGYGPPPPQGGPRPPPGGPSNQQYPPQQFQGRMPPQGQGPPPPEDGTSQQQQQQQQP